MAEVKTIGDAHLAKWGIRIRCQRGTHRGIVRIMEGAAHGDMVHNWWSKVEGQDIPAGRDLTREDFATADYVRSVRAANLVHGLLLVFGSEKGSMRFFMTPKFAASIAWAVDEIGKKAAWWDDDYGIIPNAGSMN